MTRARCTQWMQVAQCEAGGQQRRVSLTSLSQIQWRIDKAYDGGLQFSPATWTSNVYRVPAIKLTFIHRRDRRLGLYHHAYTTPPAVQILAGETLRLRPDSSGLGNWPVCRAWFYG